MAVTELTAEQKRSLKVTSGVLEQECNDLNIVFNHWITHGVPMLAAKVASTMDGKIACRTGESKWITGEDARAHVHLERAHSDMILVGRGTYLADAPRLDVRLRLDLHRTPAVVGRQKL